MECQAKTPSVAGKPALMDGPPQLHDSLRRNPRAPAGGGQVLLEGKLQFNDRGRLISRCCLLFPDRLDAWDHSHGMVKRQPPQVRILLAEVHSMEVVNSGFILVAGSRKRGIHVGTNEELRAWCAQLVKLLAPAQDTRREEEEEEEEELGAATSTWPKEARAKPPSWMPRVATLSPPPHRQPRQKFPAHCRKRLGGQPPAGADAIAGATTPEKDMSDLSSPATVEGPASPATAESPASPAAVSRTWDVRVVATIGGRSKSTKPLAAADMFPNPVWPRGTHAVAIDMGLGDADLCLDLFGSMGTREERIGTMSSRTILPSLSHDKWLTFTEDFTGGSGGLEFSARLLWHPCVVKVTVIGANGLRNADWGVLNKGLSDPYCRCEHLGANGSSKARFQTRYIEDTLDPEWWHSGSFENYWPGDTLLFEVFDKDFGKRDDFLGKKALRLPPSMYNGTPVEETLTLEESGTPCPAILRVKCWVEAPTGTIDIDVTRAYGLQPTRDGFAREGGPRPITLAIPSSPCGQSSPRGPPSSCGPSSPPSPGPSSLRPAGAGIFVGTSPRTVKLNGQRYIPPGQAHREVVGKVFEHPAPLPPRAGPPGVADKVGGSTTRVFSPRGPPGGYPIGKIGEGRTVSPRGAGAGPGAVTGKITGG